MRKVLSKESNHKLSLQNHNNKMNKAKYRTLYVRVDIQENIDILDIYDKYNNNDEIENLYKNNNKNTDLLVIKDLVQDYLKIEKSEKYVKVLENNIVLKDLELYLNSKDIFKN